MSLRKEYIFRTILNQTLFKGYLGLICNKLFIVSLKKLNNIDYLIKYKATAFWIKLWKNFTKYSLYVYHYYLVLQKYLKYQFLKDLVDEPLENLYNHQKICIHSSFKYPYNCNFNKRRIYLSKFDRTSFFKDQDTLIGNSREYIVLHIKNHWQLLLNKKQQR